MFLATRQLKSEFCIFRDAFDEEADFFLKKKGGGGII